MGSGKEKKEKILTSLGLQSPSRMFLPSLSHSRILAVVASSSFIFFISRDWPPRRVCLDRPSRAFSTNSISLMRSSSLMIVKSRTGSTSPSTWIISASSKQRTTWKMASTARMCDKKELPRPAPVEAPRVRPAISYTVKLAGTCDLGL